MSVPEETLHDLLERAAEKDSIGSIFVAVRRSPIVMRGAEFIARACSHTMAKRIANALNRHTPNERGE